MKLSFLGMKKLMAWASNDIKGDLKDLEFEQKDFKGSGLLTVEEAKLAKRYEVYLDSYIGERVVRLKIHNPGNQQMLFYTICGGADAMSELAIEILNAVEKLRAEQAEINHAKGDI